MIPLLEGDILGPKEYREGIHRLPFFIYTDCRKLCWPVVSMAICNPQLAKMFYDKEKMEKNIEKTTIKIQ